MDFVVDLDNDSLLISPNVSIPIEMLCARDSRPGIVSFRIADETGHTAGTSRVCGHPIRCAPKGLVTTFLGDGHALSMPMPNQISRWPEEFFCTTRPTVSS